eukprot:gene9277-1364_t
MGLSEEKTKQKKQKKPPKFLPRPWFWFIKAPIFTCFYIVAPLITWILLTKNLLVVTSTSTGGESLEHTMAYMGTQPITDILIFNLSTVTCPKGYNELTSTPVGGLFNEGNVYYATFYFMGTHAGCSCSDRKARLVRGCSTAELKAGCKRYESQGEQHLKYWKSNLICIKQEGPSKIQRPKMVNGACPSDFKVCGNICQLSTASCPLTSISLVNQNTGILFDADNNLYLKKEIGGEFPIVHIDISRGRFQTTAKTICSNGKPIRIDNCENFFRILPNPPPEDLYPDARFKLFDKINETRLFKDNKINLDLAFDDIPWQMSYINEIVWDNTTISQKDFVASGQFIPSFITFFIALFFIDCVTCILTTILNPCLMFSFGRQCELWCVHKLSFQCLIRLRILEIVIGFSNQFWNIIELVLVILIVTTASKIQGFLVKILSINTDATTKQIINAVAVPAIDQVSFIGYFSLVFSIIMIIWLFFSISISMLEIVSYCIRRRNLKQKEEISKSDDIEMEEMDKINVQVKSQSFSSSNQNIMTTVSNTSQTQMLNTQNQPPVLLTSNTNVQPIYRPIHQQTFSNHNIVATNNQQPQVRFVSNQNMNSSPIPHQHPSTPKF